MADLVTHIAISVGLPLGLLDSIQTGQPGRDRASFFIAGRSRVAPVVYDYAVEHAAAHDRAGLLERTRATFAAGRKGIRQHPPNTIGSGLFALARLDQWVPTRVVEAVVHGIDLTDALERTSVRTPSGIATTAAILDDVLARRTVAGRPRDLADDVAWVRAASGRAPHPDPRLPAPAHRLTNDHYWWSNRARKRSEAVPDFSGRGR